MWKIAYIDSSRWISVAKQQGEDVVLAVVPGLSDEAEVRWVGSAIGIACSFLIGIGPRQRVTQAAWTCKILALIIGAILHLRLQISNIFGSLRPACIGLNCSPLLLRLLTHIRCRSLSKLCMQIARRHDEVGKDQFKISIVHIAKSRCGQGLLLLPSPSPPPLCKLPLQGYGSAIAPHYGTQHIPAVHFRSKRSLESNLLSSISRRTGGQGAPGGRSLNFL